MRKVKTLGTSSQSRVWPRRLKIMKLIKLTKDKYSIIDDEDYETISKNKWSAYKGHNTYYACRTIKKDKKKTSVQMHRTILKLTDPSLVVDHVNGNGLDNRKENLRICTDSQNLMNRSKPKNNTSGYKGVSYSKSKKKYTAQIGINWKVYNLGFYDTAEEASKVYQERAKKEFGKFYKK
jgi:beta-glucosidase/6-phospho-beta-glucosidase/beta-galactosidase